MTTNEITSTLTFLYLEKQDLSNLTPEELSDKYTDVYDRIKSSRTKDKTSKVKILD